jgi:hypothetical protein
MVASVWEGLLGFQYVGDVSMRISGKQLCSRIGRPGDWE